MPGRSPPGAGVPPRRPSPPANPRSCPQDRGIWKIRTSKKLGSVAGRHREPYRMKKPILLVIVAEIALIATAVLYLAFHELWIIFIGVFIGGVAVLPIGRLVGTTRENSGHGQTVGVGTVCTVDESAVAAGRRQV